MIHNLIFSVISGAIMGTISIIYGWSRPKTAVILAFNGLATVGVLHLVGAL